MKKLKKFAAVTGAGAVFGVGVASFSPIIMLAGAGASTVLYLIYKV